jgi:hypothetical protein
MFNAGALPQTELPPEEALPEDTTQITNDTEE